jgi:hypothetical protein
VVDVAVVAAEATSGTPWETSGDRIAVGSSAISIAMVVARMGSSLRVREGAGEASLAARWTSRPTETNCTYIVEGTQLRLTASSTNSRLRMDKQ